MSPGGQSLQGRLGDASDLLRPTVHAGGFAVLDVEAELGCNHHPVPNGRQGLADDLLVRVEPVNFGGVEEGDAIQDELRRQRDPT
jgi:hypothetical protein